MWTSSARPGESVIKYQLLNGCPTLVFPILPGSPLIAWNTLTLETLDGYRTELDDSGNVKSDSKKILGVVDALYEYISLCIDWPRLSIPLISVSEKTEAKSDPEEEKRTRVREAIALVVEAAIRSGLPASIKAGASGKRISAKNAQTVKQLRLGFAVSNAVYILSLFLFRSGRSWTRLFYYSTTEVAAVVLWQQLEAMAKKGDDLAAAGLTAYMFDVLYVTWFVHVTTALLSTKFWWLYLSIPSYAIYRFGSLLVSWLTGGHHAA
ncbi:hypothetical protein RQP46_008462 [Phenoliferia psychrophenolica]